jgi:hypothetical protein
MPGSRCRAQPCPVVFPPNCAPVCCGSSRQRARFALETQKLEICYTARTSISGSIVFSRFSMLTSVPEIELGQLPHAPW